MPAKIGIGESGRQQTKIDKAGRAVRWGATNHSMPSPPPHAAYTCVSRIAEENTSAYLQPYFPGEALFAEARMKTLSRRDVLKTSLLAPAAAAAHAMGPLEVAVHAATEASGPLSIGAPQSPSTSATGGGRERLLMDFGWRFHFGNANDAA